MPSKSPKSEMPIGQVKSARPVQAQKKPGTPIGSPPEKIPRQIPPATTAKTSGSSSKKILGSLIKTLFKIVVPLVILTLGVSGTLYLIKQKTPAKTKPAGKDRGKPVRVISLQPGIYNVTVKAQASTESLHELTLAAEIGGKVKQVSPDLVEGGWVKKNQLLFTLDDSELQLKLQEASANLTRAEFDVDLVKAQQEAADQGLKTFQSFQNDDHSQLSAQATKPGALARYEPQMKQAKAGLKSVSVSVKQAELNLKRSRIFSPFSGYVRSTSLTVGQIITPGQEVARIFRGSPVIIKVQVPLSNLEWIKVAQFKEENGQLGSMAIVRKKIGKTIHQWRGRVTRRLPEIDSLGRLAVIVIEVDATESNHGFTLPLGMFVDIAIVGKKLNNVFRIPHEVLRQNSTIWVMTKQKKLAIRSVDVIRKDDKFVYFRKGIQRGEKLIVSPLSDAVKGMKLRNFTKKSK